MRLRSKLILAAISLTVVTLPVRAQVMCPDGSYVSKGPCNLCPNGKYVGGGAQCQMAPDGSYVPQRGNSTPQLAPNGSFVPGGGQVTLCPDGSYVTGKTCILAPNGRYIGR